MKRMSRRELLQATAAASVAAAPAGADPAGLHIPIRVGPGAGPPPEGAPVEASAPLPAGRLREAASLAVVSPSGKPVAAQMRVASRWPDGSVRWLALAFEAESGPGVYALVEGRSPDAPPILIEKHGAARIDTGALALAIPGQGEWFAEPLPCDLVLTRHDGEVFRASLAADSQRGVIEERGPVRCMFRVEGQCRSGRGERLFDYILRLTAFRLRPELLLSITWINATKNPAEQVRDIRLTLPLAFAPERLVFGCDSAVYDGPYTKGWPVFLLQEDHDRYWAKTINPDGRVQHLASGGANGEHCPGWLYATGNERGLGVWVPDFWQEYPNEIAVLDNEISIGLWPERGAPALAAQPVLPRDPFGARPYANTRYWPVLPHPYVAFFDAEKKCLDAPQGLAKTQDILVSPWTSGAGSSFETKYWAGSLWPVRGHVEPRAVADSTAAGPLAPRDPATFPAIEQLYDESHGWFERHAKASRAYGKFDYGDFRYFTAGSDYLCGPGTKWGQMGEMPREGYWHNNERDTLRGLLLYYLRTGSPSAWSLVRSAAGHLLDVDIRHHPHWGMYTHSYGHCYLALGRGGEPDHSWLTGVLEWAEMTGDPLALQAATRCADHLLDWQPDFALSDARSVSVFVHVMCQFHSHTGANKYLDAARPAVAALLRLQNADGGWPAYLGDMTKPRIEGFVEHALVALADYYSITSEQSVRTALDRAISHLFPPATDWQADRGESPLALHALGVLAEKTGRDDYARLAGELLSKLNRDLNLAPDPRVRGDLWAGWGVNDARPAKVPGRPPQFLGQTRPLSPSSILAYGQQCLAFIKRRARKESDRGGAR